VGWGESRVGNVASHSNFSISPLQYRRKPCEFAME
jgi:hypothetical protein